ncbi:MAG: hypothetical protein EOM20_14760 [Spartobacteria bacterium]|nr:hypothetical protein [Spartobacteria bacterium]
MDDHTTSTPRAKSVAIFLLVVAVIAAAIYCFPRFLFRTLGEGNPWTSYFYQYGMGLIVFLIGLYVILRYRACQLGRGKDTFWFGVLIAGFIFFAVLHAVWILLALHVPFLGAV